MPFNTKKVKEILDSVLTEITPSDEDQVLQDVMNFLKQSEAEAKKLKIKAKPVLGGSFAKHTWLKGDYDVDIFFAFELKHKKDNLSDLLQKILSKFNPTRVHGSRDYFQLKNGVCFEVIPVLNIKKTVDAENVTDFSLWHVEWANKKGKKFKNDIRLAKKFCKAQKVYGAESYIRGFSGHVLDILVIHYKGFLNLLKAASKWPPKLVIDTENHYKGKALQLINKSKTESPLIVVDPVQPGRNASAAISEEKFNKFIQSAKAFIKKPSTDIFTIKQINDSELEKKGQLLKIKIIPLDGVENVIGVKILKAGEHIKKILEDFNVVFSDWEWDKKNAAIWRFVVKNKQLPKEIIVQGPPIKFPEHCKKFKSMHKKTFEKKSKLYAHSERKHTTPKEMLAAHLKDEYLKDKAKQISTL